MDGLNVITVSLSLTGLEVFPFPGFINADVLEGLVSEGEEQAGGLSTGRHIEVCVLVRGHDDGWTWTN